MSAASELKDKIIATKELLNAYFTEAAELKITFGINIISMYMLGSTVETKEIRIDDFRQIL
jgi:hypothetical protein